MAKKKAAPRKKKAAVKQPRKKKSDRLIVVQDLKHDDVIVARGKQYKVGRVLVDEGAREVRLTAVPMDGSDTELFIVRMDALARLA